MSNLRGAAEDTLGGRITLGRLAGEGGMGRVYEAIETGSGRRLAVKVLTQTTPDVVARFAAEAEILEALSHPAIVDYVGHGTTPSGEPYLAMEWLDGISLSERLRREPRLTLAEVIVIGRQVASALAAAHAAGVIHRDIKPSNLLLVDSQPERLKVLDFGIAFQASAARDLTRTGQLVGTPEYMAPEQIQGSRAVDARTDLFALGCVLFECATGQRAFEADNMMKILARILMDDLPSVRALRPETPASLASLVERLCAKLPEDRPGSAAVVLAELDAIERAVRGLGGDSVLPDRTSRAVIGVAVAGTVLLAAAAWLAWPARTAGREARVAAVAATSDAAIAEANDANAEVHDASDATVAVDREPVDAGAPRHPVATRKTAATRRNLAATAGASLEAYVGQYVAEVTYRQAGSRATGVPARAKTHVMLRALAEDRVSLELRPGDGTSCDLEARRTELKTWALLPTQRCKNGDTTLLFEHADVHLASATDARRAQTVHTLWVRGALVVSTPADRTAYTFEISGLKL